MGRRIYAYKTKKQARMLSVSSKKTEDTDIVLNKDVVENSIFNFAVCGRIRMSKATW